MECVRRTHLSGASDFSGPLGRSQGAAGPHQGDRRGRLLGDRHSKCPSDVKQKQRKSEALSLGRVRFGVSRSHRSQGLFLLSISVVKYSTYSL